MAKKKKTRSRSSDQSLYNTLRNNPFLKYFAVFAFAVVGFLAFNQFTSHGKPSVLGVATSSYTNATVTWDNIPWAFGYNIYYKTDKDSRYVFAVRNLPRGSTSYTINYLQKGKVYQYEVKAYEQSKKEKWSSGQKTLRASN